MVSLLLILFVTLILPGLIVRSRALLAGRRGVPFYQHLNLLGVLLQKDPIQSPVTGFVSRLAPLVYLGALTTAMLLLPVGNFEPLFSFEGDVVLFCYLLSLSRVALILAAMDAGSSFQGMGASREALYGALVEPALFLVIGTLALVSGQGSFAELFAAMDASRGESILVMLLLVYALFKITLVEGGRIPMDDPKTHLELTMIHEVMILDYSGFDLGLILFGGWLKMALFATLAGSALASTLHYNALLVVLVALLFGLCIGVLESFMARGRLARNTTYIMTIIALAFVVFTIGYLILQNVTI